MTAPWLLGSVATAPQSGTTPINLGETNILTTADTGDATQLTSQPITLGSAGTLQSLSLYVATASGNIRLGLFTDNAGTPGSKIAETGSVALVAGWNTLAVTSSQQSAGQYWIVFQTDSNSAVFRLTASGGPCKYYNATYGTMPATWSATFSTGTLHFSFYATFLIGASAPVVNTGGFSLSLPATNGQVVGTMTASGSPTSWSITAGNSAGYFAINNSGVVTVTSTGASSLTAGSYSLTCQATNSVGSGSGTAGITVAAAAAPVVNNSSFNLTVPASVGATVGTMTASNSPTSWAITAGDTPGYFAIDNSGVITVTTAGASGLTAGTYSLTCQATNATGSGTGTATVTAAVSSGNILHATTSNFAAQVSAAVAGDTILLANGNYGAWAGTNKAITIAPESGASPTIGLALSSTASSFTIDGGHTEISASTNGMVRSTLPFTSTGISLNTYSNSGASGGNNVTIKRCWLVSQTFSGGFFEFTNTGAITMTFDRCFFTGITIGEAVIRNQVHGSTQNIIVKNCFFYDLTCDGVKIDSSGITVQDCEFNKVNPHGTPEHTDCIQFQGSAASCTIVRNLFLDFEQACSGFDGMDSCTITDNVVNNLTTPAVHWISCFADNPASNVKYNTLWGSAIGGGTSPAIICCSKTGGATSITNITNNIADISTGGPVNGSPTSNNHNMWPGAGSPNINGTPTFVGGSNPTTYQGYKLTSGSNGVNASSDGINVGARIA